MTSAVDRAVDAASVGTSVVNDFTIIGLFMQADLIVKVVMLMLVFASVWSWTIIIDKRGSVSFRQKGFNSREDFIALLSGKIEAAKKQ